MGLNLFLCCSQLKANFHLMLRALDACSNSRKILHEDRQAKCGMNTNTKRPEIPVAAATLPEEHTILPWVAI